MRDLRDDPNFPADGIRDYDGRLQWAAVAVMLLMCAGLIFAATYTGDETQTAMNTPSVEQPTTAPVTGMLRKP